LQKDKVTRAYTSNKELGLFYLFLTKAVFESLHTWTNTCLEEKRKKKVSALKSLEHFGLEMAMSISQVNR
jgi:hypothetical protein